MINRLIAPIGAVSGKLGAPNSQDSTSAIVLMPDSNGRTLSRRFVQPSNPDTDAQQQMRGIFSTISEAIQSLTQPQVDEWAAIAATIRREGRLGLSFNLSWTMLFQMVNSYRQQDGAAIVLDPPALDSTIPCTAIGISSDDGDPSQTLAISLTALASTGRKWAIRVTRALGSPVRLARKTDLRYPADPGDCILAGAGTGPELSILADRLNIFQDDNVGVYALPITPNYYPGLAFFAKNLLVEAP